MQTRTNCWTNSNERSDSPDPPLVLGLDGIEDPHNMGSILRTAECAGVHGVFIAERRAVGLTSVVAKVAAGALEYVPVARVTNLVRLIEQLKERNIWVVGAAAEAKQLYTDWDWKLPAAVFLGSEGHGLAPVGSRTLRHPGTYTSLRQIGIIECFGGGGRAVCTKRNASETQTERRKIMFCPKCATQNLDGASFCRACGANISLVPQALTGQMTPTACEQEVDEGGARSGEDAARN